MKSLNYLSNSLKQVLASLFFSCENVVQPVLLSDVSEARRPLDLPEGVVLLPQNQTENHIGVFLENHNTLNPDSASDNERGCSQAVSIGDS